MLRVIVIVMTLSTVVLVVTAMFFLSGRFAAVNRRAMADMDRAAYAKVESRWTDLNDRAMTHFKRGEHEEARWLWQPFVAEYPRHVEAHYRLGVCFATQGQLEEGTSYLERAAELAPGDPRIMKELGICYLQAGRLDDAERELKAVVSRDKLFPEAHFYLGMICEKRRDYDRAQKYYVKELNANPCNTYAWYKIQTWKHIPSNRNEGRSASPSRVIGIGGSGVEASEGPR